MCKHRPPKIQSNMFDCLALRLIDSHSKRKSDRKLPSSKLKGHLLFCWIVVDPWHKHLMCSMVPSNQLHLDHPIPESCQDPPTAIAHLIYWIQVFEDHY